MNFTPAFTRKDRAMNQQQDESIISIIVGFPAYIFRYAFGMVLSILTDITMTSLALGSFFLGYATTLAAGLATYFLLHTVIKMVNAISGAQVRQGSLVGNAIMRHAGVFASQQHEPPSQPLDPVGEEIT